MRIIAGMYRGRRIDVPPRGVRPTLDRVRESVFGMLGEFVVGADVLDLYAGSGALGLEALSRGAGSVCWVESNRNTFQTLEKNIDRLAGKTEGIVTQLQCRDALRYLRNAPPVGFDLIFADPPYDRKGDGGQIAEILAAIAAARCLAADGLLIYEAGSSESFELPTDWNTIRDKTWGATRIIVLAPASRQ